MLKNLEAIAHNFSAKGRGNTVISSTQSDHGIGSGVYSLMNSGHQLKMKHRNWRKTAYQSTALVAVVLVVVIIYITMPYFTTVPVAEFSADQELLLDELYAKKQRWEENRPASFRYVVERKCACPAEHMNPFPVVEDLDAKNIRVSWIDDFFVTIEEAILDSAQVAVTYDALYSFPVGISISYPDGPEDSWQEIYIREFDILRY